MKLNVIQDCSDKEKEFIAKKKDLEKSQLIAELKQMGSRRTPRAKMDCVSLSHRKIEGLPSPMILAANDSFGRGRVVRVAQVMRCVLQLKQGLLECLGAVGGQGPLGADERNQMIHKRSPFLQQNCLKLDTPVTFVLLD